MILVVNAQGFNKTMRMNHLIRKKILKNLKKNKRNKLQRK